jgi:hypothetical protein
MATERLDFSENFRQDSKRTAIHWCLVMFPFFFNTCGNTCSGTSRQEYQEKKLKFLKWMRDDLETRLAGLNAAIETIERQINREGQSPS